MKNGAAVLGPSFRLDGNFNGTVPSHYGDVTANGGGISRNEVETLAGFAF